MPDHIRDAHQENQANLLIISSDSIARDLLEVILKQQGFKVDPARNFTQGLEVIKKNEYDAVFIDTRWHGAAPGRLMLDISHHSSQNHPLVIFIVEDNDSSSMRKIRQAGADTIIRYPFGHHDIISVMEIIERKSGTTALSKDNADFHLTAAGPGNA